MNGVIKIGDIIRHGEQSRGVVFEITGSSWSEYEPPAGSLHALISDDNGIPYKLNTSHGKRYMSFTVYNWPDEMARTCVIGHVESKTLEPYIKERLEDAEKDRKQMDSRPTYYTKRVSFKGRGKHGEASNKPTCPECGEDLKNCYETQKNEEGKQHWVKIGKQCKKCKYIEWDQ